MPVSTAFPLPSEGAYLIRRPILSEGLQLKPGDLLPANAAVRKNQRRLEVLYRTRYIQPATLPNTVATAARDLSFLTRDELIFLCKNRGLATRGSDDALRERLDSALG